MRKLFNNSFGLYIGIKIFREALKLQKYQSIQHCKERQGKRKGKVSEMSKNVNVQYDSRRTSKEKRLER